MSWNSLFIKITKNKYSRSDYVTPLGSSSFTIKDQRAPLTGMQLSISSMTTKLNIVISDSTVVTQWINDVVMIISSLLGILIPPKRLIIMWISTFYSIITHFHWQWQQDIHKQRILNPLLYISLNIYIFFISFHQQWHQDIHK